jgi:hypothetical protein
VMITAVLGPVLGAIADVRGAEERRCSPCRWPWASSQRSSWPRSREAGGPTRRPSS